MDMLGFQKARDIDVFPAELRCRSSVSDEAAVLSSRKDHARTLSISIVVVAAVVVGGDGGDCLVIADFV